MNELGGGKTDWGVQFFCWDSDCAINEYYQDGDKRDICVRKGGSVFFCIVLNIFKSGD